VCIRHAAFRIELDGPATSARVQTDSAARRQCRRGNGFRQQRFGPLARCLKGKSRTELSRVGCPTEQAHYGDEDEQGHEPEREHDSNYVMVEILPPVAEISLCIDLPPNAVESWRA
jgi:hypothetical protein